MHWRGKTYKSVSSCLRKQNVYVHSFLVRGHKKWIFKAKQLYCKLVAAAETKRYSILYLFRDRCKVSVWFLFNFLPGIQNKFHVFWNDCGVVLPVDKGLYGCRDWQPVFVCWLAGSFHRSPATHGVYTVSRGVTVNVYPLCI